MFVGQVLRRTKRMVRSGDRDVPVIRVTVLAGADTEQLEL